MSGYEGHVAKRQRTDMDPTVYSGQTQSGGGGGGNFEQETKPNHILLITVLNPAYPITCDVLQKICSGSGQVIRIVIFKKNGVQAMVEFDNVQSAVAAKDKLNGKDIYSGCCTLKIEFAKPDKLNVFKNDDESWDYTNPNLGGGNNMNNMSGTMNQGMSQGMNNMTGGMNQGMGQNMGMNQGMGQNMGMNQGMNQMSGNMGQNMGMGQGMNQMPNTMGQGMTGNMGGMTGTPMAGMMGGGQMGGPMGGTGPMMPMGGPMGGGPMGGGPMGGGRGYGMDGSGYGYAGGMAQSMSGGYSGYSTGTGDNYGNGYRQNMNRGYGEPEGDYHDTADEGAPGCVLMIYGLDHDTMNCDRLFNIFCLYGNVSRIKFLKSKEGCAMVQMGDPGGAQRVLSNLNGVEFFGRKMSLGPSKQSALQDVPQPFDLSDGTPSYKEYIGVRNNRFVNADAARKNRIQSPTGVLHYFNAPPDVSEQEIQQVFERADAPIPITVKPFPQKNPDKASSGILEFTNAVAATEALIKCNHSSVKTKGGKFPYTFKLCFSSATRK